jgi:cell division protease FtsH
MRIFAPEMYKKEEKNIQQTPDRKPARRPSGKNKKGGFNPMWIYILVAIALGYLYTQSDNMLGAMASKQVSYSRFKYYVEQGYARGITANKDEGKLSMQVVPGKMTEVFGTLPKDLKEQPELVTEYPSNDKLEEFVDEQQRLGHFRGEVKYTTSDNTVERFLWNFGPILFFIFLWIFIMRRAGGGDGASGPLGIFNVGKSRAKLHEKNDKDDDKDRVTFKDVAGQEGAKMEVQEIVEFLKNPNKYTDLGGKIPKGALLVGPPGTGKTLLAKAVAGEADVPFFSMSGSDFVEMFVGVGASRVRDLFRQAQEKAPCIVFIDEIDAVGRARSKSVAMGGNDERENTLNQLLTEMDGFGTNSGVIVLAATNRADVLDKALLRAGRFDRQIYVDLPDVHERKAIFQVHMRPLKIDDTVDVDFLSRQTPGFSGADIANVCNEAALIAARNSHERVGKEDFLAAVDRIIGGLEKKTKVLTEEEKRTIALHEAGHATVSWHLEYANPLVKVTIVPRGRALGAAWYLPEERQITTREQMLDEVCALLGGRAAEELFTGHISSGAMNDLERVSHQVYAMIAYMGMGESLPNISFYNMGGEYQVAKPYSEKTAEKMDEEARKMVAEQYERAKKILLAHKEGHGELAQILMDREVIFADDVKKIFGERPWKSRADELTNDDKTEE